MKRKVIGLLEEVAAVVKDVWAAAENSGFCCGIQLDSGKCSESMPTPSSCCGVRV